MKRKEELTEKLEEESARAEVLMTGKSLASLITFVKFAALLKQSRLDVEISNIIVPFFNFSENDGLLEVDEGTYTSHVTQKQIRECVDITTASKSFDLNLNQFGPYRLVQIIEFV